MEIGDEQIYRASYYAPSERVAVRGVEKRKQSMRIDIEYLDGKKAGRRENVPGSRLHGPWSDVDAFDELRSNWLRLNGNGDGLDDAEQSAVLAVLIALVPEDIAIYDNSPVRHGISISDVPALERLMKRSIGHILDQVEWFDYQGELELSSVGTLLMAEYVASANPVPMLEVVVAEEAEAREGCKRGRERDFYDGSGKQMSSPEYEYARYRKYDRPKHELIRSWCGHRAVSFVEQLTAAEAEVQRLDVLVAQVIDRLRTYDTNMADYYEREHNEERIRPETIRPVVDRPLAPWEIPVREVRVRGRRWQ